MMTKHKSLLLFLGLWLTAVGCIDQEAYENISIANEQEIAIPLINSSVSISSVTDKVDSENTSIQVDEEGKVTVFYDGEVLRQTSRQLFPALPGLTDFPLVDTNVFIPLPIDPKYKISKANFGDTNIFFNFKSEEKGNYVVKVSLPQTDKNGETWSAVYNFTIDDDNQNIFTELISLKGWEIIPDNNSIQFVYEAYNEFVDKVEFDYVAMRVDQLVFDYVEGYFAYQVFDIQGSDIGIGLFESWESGGLSFDDPKMNISVENSMGFPVRSKVNYVRLNTLNNGTFELESEFIDKGIDFEYPSVNEVGVTKTSGFSFNKDNSNIRDLFQDKVVNVAYDIDALANPDQDTTIINFVDSTSFFSVKVAVEIPLLGSINEFVLKQESEASFSDLEEIREATFKTIISNDFPTDMWVQAYFKNANGVVLDSLFEGEPFTIGAATLGPDERTTTPFQNIEFIKVSGEKLDRIIQSNSVEIKTGLDNTDTFEGDLWLYDSYKVDVKMGAIIEVK